MVGSIALSATMAACTAESYVPLAEESTEAAVPLTKFQGAIARPPQLSYGKTVVQPYAVDWKHRELTETSNRTGSMPPALVVDGTASSQLALDSAMQPEYLQVSIFYGSASEIDPMSEPDESFICSQKPDSSCITSTKGDVLLVHLPEDTLPRKQKALISVGAEYLAELNLNSERFVNTVSWVLELDFQ